MSENKSEFLMGLHEAMNKGYFYWGYDGEQWQSLKDLSDLTASDFENGRGDKYLFEPSARTTSISEEDLRDLIADHIEDNHESETGDDTMEVYETIKSLNFDQTVAYINEALSKHKWHSLTKIKLYFDNQTFQD